MTICFGKSCSFGLIVGAFCESLSVLCFWILGLDIGFEGNNSLSLCFILLWIDVLSGNIEYCVN